MPIAHLGDAKPIVRGPVQEELVEGHTVFATIDQYPGGAGAAADRGAATATVSWPVPSEGGGADAARRIERHPGVTWFNDQYLVPPRWSETTGLGTGITMSASFGAAVAVLVREDDGRVVREPCGGAVMAVNAGDPDPRLALASLSGGGGTVVVGPDGAHSDAGVTGIAGIDYDESYLITDPNDHSWVIDRYVAYTRVGTGGLATLHEFPVWVANLHGSPAFVPDTPRVAKVGDPIGDHCTPHGGVADALLSFSAGFFCGVEPAVELRGAPPWQDDPCMGYTDPTRNGLCYRSGEYGASTNCGEGPARRYHALLYFDWADLRAPSIAVDHSDPSLSLDATGCQSGTEWPCPGEEAWVGQGMDGREGNSHAAHPIMPPHEEADARCPLPGTHATNPTNHGGSLHPNGYCDHYHAGAAVDLYYSGQSRPLEPAVRFWSVFDLSGSSEAFHDFHTAYPGMP